jgi:hypothetical protein
VLAAFAALVVVLAFALSEPAGASPGPFSYVTNALAFTEVQPTSVSCLPGLCIGVDFNGDVYLTSGTKAVKLATTGRYLFAIACPAPAFCVAVGNSDEVTFTASSIYAHPLTAGRGTYVHWESVSCASARFCVAGGGIIQGHHAGAGVVSSWNGTAWTTAKVIAPFLPSNTHTFIDSMSCINPSFCVAADGNGREFQWNGRVWSPIRTLESMADTFNLSCTSVRFCVALGENSTFATWDGHRWKFRDGPAGEHFASGVSCSSPTFCLSIDDSGNAESWNGTTWSAPELVDPNQYLIAVSCSRAFSCEAVDGEKSVVYFTDTSKPPSIAEVCALGGCLGSTT